MIDLESMPAGTLLTTEQVAEALATPATTLSLWRTRKNVALPYIKLGTNVRYRAGDIVAFIAAQTQGRAA